MIAASDTRDEFAGLFSVYEWIMIVTAAIVFAVVLAAAVVWRRRPGHEPSKKTEANVAELLYVLVLAGVIGVLVYYTFTTEDRVDAVAAATKPRIDVEGFQWGWRFTYAGGVSVVGDLNDPPTLHVPTGTRILFTITSRDVIHSFWIPGMRFKRDAFPDATTKFELAFDRTGRYDGRCAEFCGLHHEDMSFTVVAESRSEFQDWLDTQRPGA